MKRAIAINTAADVSPRCCPILGAPHWAPGASNDAGGGPPHVDFLNVDLFGDDYKDVSHTNVFDLPIVGEIVVREAVRLISEEQQGSNA